MLKFGGKKSHSFLFHWDLVLARLVRDFLHKEALYIFLLQGMKLKSLIARNWIEKKWEEGNQKCMEVRNKKWSGLFPVNAYMFSYECDSGFLLSFRELSPYLCLIIVLPRLSSGGLRPFCSRAYGLFIRGLGLLEKNDRKVPVPRVGGHKFMQKLQWKVSWDFVRMTPLKLYGENWIRHPKNITNIVNYSGKIFV